MYHDITLKVQSKLGQRKLKSDRHRQTRSKHPCRQEKREYHLKSPDRVTRIDRADIYMQLSSSQRNGKLFK
jgi:hypothetical protein